MKFTIFRCICFAMTLIASLFLVMSCAKDIVDLNGTIQGVVKDYNTGALLSNCQIALSPSGKTAVTNSNGIFEFGELEQGTYTLSFSRAGYEETTQTVKVVSGETVTVNITLKAKSAFAASSNKLDFGDLSSTMELFFFNNSDETTSFTISNVPMWASVSHASGTVAAGGNIPVTVQVNRDAVDYGTHTQVLSVAYKGKVNGTVNVTIQMQKVHLTAPKVSIGVAAENITQNEFTIEGELLATGGSEVTSYGHCWSLTSNPTVENFKKDNGATTSIGKFKTIVTQLTPGTSYYVRAFATNQYGTTYSQEIVVTTQDVASNKWDGNVAKSFARGSGTSVDPYIIETGGQLMLMKDYNNKCFELANNIDLDNKNWLPFEFKGTLDGKGCTISNLRIDRSTEKLGLFSSVSSAVRNLTIKNVRIEAPSISSIGALAGECSYSGTLTDCHVILTENSQITGMNKVGGLIGSSNGKISNCSVEYSGTKSDVIKGNNNVGGLVGLTFGSSDPIKGCKVFANIKGASDVGGIIGSLNNDYDKGKIEECSYKGIVSGEKAIGGIAGSLRGDVIACKADVELNVSNSFGGGIVGQMIGPDIIHHIIACYANGILKSSSDELSFGGILGGNNGYNRNSESILSYSTMSSSASNFDGLSGTGNSNPGFTPLEKCSYSASTSSTRFSETNTGNCKDITTFLRECYQTEYDRYWNYSKTWTWTGVIDGEQVSVSCPRLEWE